MKRLFFALAVSFSSSELAYGKGGAVKVAVTPSAAEMFFGQSVIAEVAITNVGKDSLIIPRPDRAVFSSLLSVDNPNLNFSGGIGIISVMGESPTTDLKPGQTVKTKVSLSGRTGGASKLTFRIGFRPTVTSEVIWSKPTTIHLKKVIELSLPVSVEVSLKTKTIDIANPRDPQRAVAHLIIKNIGSGPEEIGTAGVCCDEELADSLISDNPDIKVESGGASCISSGCAPGDVSLAPGRAWEQDCRLAYWGDIAQPKPISFRIGVKPRGRLAAWSMPVTVSIAGGTEQWTKHIVWLKNKIKDAEVTSHPDGVAKTFYENGKIMEERTYRGGKLNGPYKRYHDNGQLSEELHYVDNAQDGPHKSYDKTGKSTGETMYSNNQMIGYITYNKDGSIHHHVKTMRFVEGNYVPLQDPCAEHDSDLEIRKTMPGCSTVVGQ